MLNKPYTLYSPEHCGGVVTQSAEPTHIYNHAKEGLRYGGPLRQYRVLGGAMSLHHLAIMTKLSLSCPLCMLAIPIFPFLKFACIRCIMEGALRKVP